jgi:hypothetical protein
LHAAIDAYGDVAATFDGSLAGTWRYEDRTGWVRLTTGLATHLDIAGPGYVAAAFGGSLAGLWRFEDRTGWRQLDRRQVVDSSAIAINSSGDVAATIQESSYTYSVAIRYKGSGGVADLLIDSHLPYNANVIGMDDQGNVLVSGSPNTNVGVLILREHGYNSSVQGIQGGPWITVGDFA